MGLKALISGGNCRKRLESEGDRTSDANANANGQNTETYIRGDISQKVG